MEKTFTKKELPDIVAEALRAIQTQGSSIIALSGDLGAGKTTFTQELARQFGITETVISPTFIIMKKYQIVSDNSPWKTLVHIDAYRLNSSEELLKLGWKEMVMSTDTLILIEWPERVPECIPKDALKITLEHINPETRKISY